MAISLFKKAPENLRLRLMSALLLGPPVLVAVFFGEVWFDVIVAAAALAMAWEWSRICCGVNYGISVWVFSLGIICVLSAVFLEMPEVAFFVIALGGSIVFVMGMRENRQTPINMSLGMVLIGVFAFTSLWIRDFPGSGRDFMIWLLLSVWFSDIGGYFFGRVIGGKKLAPKISPNKSWSGFGGGLLLASCWSGYWLMSSADLSLVVALMAGVGISALAQLGDLSISAVKRQYGVKDASGLIPGHGGVLDRLDGMLLTAPTLAIVLFVVDRGWL